MHSKKVVIVGPGHPYRGGLATFNERLAVEFNLHHQAEICTFKLQYPGFLFPGTSQYTNEAAPKNIKIIRSLNSINPFNWIIQGLKYKKSKPDLIVFRYWMPFFGPCFGLFARIVKSNKHTKIVAITDNIIPHEKRFFDSAFTSYFLKCLDGAICMSSSVLNDLQSFHFSKFSIVNPHPLYDNFGPLLDKTEARKALNIPVEENIILFFGFIRKYKGLDILLEALKILKDKGNKVKLLIAGEFYEDRKFYDDIIEKNNLINALYLHTDFIPNERVSTYFSACDLVVQPYKDATQSGVSQVAYQFEKPMVVTNVGSLAEFIPNKKVGYVVEPNSIEVAKAVEDFFALDNGNYFLSEIQKQKQIFSWAQLVKNLFTAANITS